MYEILIINKKNGDRRFTYTRDLNKVELGNDEFIDYCEFID